MKRTVLIFAVLFALSFASISFAEDSQQGMMEGGGPQGGRQQGGMMNPMMMGMMNKPTMISTSDGGVIVLAGPRLAKYDKDLNLVKEVELKRDKPEQGQNPGQPPAQGQ